MKATLFVIPGSHPSIGARLMLEKKGIDYRRIDLIPVVSKGVLRAAGFGDTTVPALRLDGERIQGTSAIARALDGVVPEPRLLPEDADRRVAVEEAERWGDTEVQEVPRRIIWNVLDRDPRGRRSYLEGARLGLPVGLAAKTAPPLVYLSKRFNNATDEQVRADLAALPGIVERVDQLLIDGVIGTAEPNVADFHIAPSMRLLMTMDDTRPFLEGHSAADYAMWFVPEYPGYAPAALPEDWKQPHLAGASA